MLFVETFHTSTNIVIEAVYSYSNKYICDDKTRASVDSDILTITTSSNFKEMNYRTTIKINLGIYLFVPKIAAFNCCG